MKLYEIDQKIQAILDGAEVDAETGELLLDTEELEALQMEREAKLEGVALAIKNLSAEAAAIREEEKKLAERRKVTENKVERLKGWLAWALDGGKLSTPRVSVSVGKPAQSAVVDDVWRVVDWKNALFGGRMYTEMTPEEQEQYNRITDTLDMKYPAPTISKTGVKKLLSEYEIPGVHLEEGKPVLRIK